MRCPLWSLTKSPAQRLSIPSFGGLISQVIPSIDAGCGSSVPKAHQYRLSIRSGCSRTQSCRSPCQSSSASSLPPWYPTMRCRAAPPSLTTRANSPYACSISVRSVIASMLVLPWWLNDKSSPATATTCKDSAPRITRPRSASDWLGRRVCLTACVQRPQTGGSAGNGLFAEDRWIAENYGLKGEVLQPNCNKRLVSRSRLRLTYELIHCSDDPKLFYCSPCTMRRHFLTVL